jgi:phage gpG-like protein
MPFSLDLGPILRDIQTLREQLKNPNKPLLSGKILMKWIGALGSASSQKAFREQALGDIKWEPRYPDQEPPKFNIAGALMDWKSGRKAPKPNRFQDRPALIDEGIRGGMQGSLTFEVTGPLSVSWGSGKPYAEKHQNGGDTTIPYDDATKKRISEWIYKKPPQRRKVMKGILRTNQVKTGPGMSRSRSEYAKHITPLLASNTWKQRIIARPFVGVTDELAGDIKSAILLYFKKVQE